jgi:hypothetical protein
MGQVFQRPPRTLWPEWIGANSLAWLLGYGLAHAFARLLFWSDITIQLHLERANYIWARPTASPLGSIGYMLILGAIVGVAQGALLRRVFDIKLRDWVGATVLGFVVYGLLISIFYNLAIVQGRSVLLNCGQALLLVAAIVVFPLPQWHILKRHVRRAGWWIVVSVVAIYVTQPPTGTSSLPGWIMTTLFLGALFGTLTAIGLSVLTRSPKEPESDMLLEADGADE